MNELKELRQSCSVRSIYRDQNKTEEPTYDVKAIDKKISKIHKTLLKIDVKIKESNAKTTIDLDIDMDDLVSEIE